MATLPPGPLLSERRRTLLRPMSSKWRNTGDRTMIKLGRWKTRFLTPLLRNASCARATPRVHACHRPMQKKSSHPKLNRLRDLRGRESRRMTSLAMSLTDMARTQESHPSPRYWRARINSCFMVMVSYPRPAVRGAVEHWCKAWKIWLKLTLGDCRLCRISRIYTS